jgi:methyl-accepting chemotaxis protein
VAASPTTVAVADFDFDQAVEAHRAWKVKLRSAIANREQLDSDTICRDDRCPLGRWLHGPGGAQWGARPAFVKLVDEHAEFHRAAGEVAATINRGAYDDAERLLGSGSRFAEASNRTVTAILRVKRDL